MNRSAIEKILMGLPKDQASVLYWKCQGLNYVDIGEKLHISFQTVTREMAFVYEKLGPIIGIDEDTHPQARMRILKNDVCDALMHLIDGNPEFLQRFPLSGPIFEGKVVRGGEESAVQTLPKPDPKPEILAMVIYDGMVLERLRKQESAGGHETLTGEAVDSEEYERKKEEERFRLEKERQQQSAGTPPRPNIWALIIGVLLFALVCVIVLWLGGDRILAAISPDPTAVSTNTAQGPTSTSASILPSRTPTITNSPTPAITPTPFPWLDEDFSVDLSDLWEIYGDPFRAEGREPFSGVLTVSPAQDATLKYGNDAWTNYTVATAVLIYDTDVFVTIGMRVRDINNYVGLKCNLYRCAWGYMINGSWTELKLLNEGEIYIFSLVIVVDGDILTATGSGWGWGTQEKTNFIEIPPNLQEKHSKGGVLVEFQNGGEVDYFKVHPFP